MCLNFFANSKSRQFIFPPKNPANSISRQTWSRQFKFPGNSNIAFFWVLSISFLGFWVDQFFYNRFYFVLKNHHKKQYKMKWNTIQKVYGILAVFQSIYEIKKKMTKSPIVINVTLINVIEESDKIHRIDDFDKIN